MADRIERIRARQTASSERYPTHIGCGAEVWQPHGSWVCARCGRVTLDAVMLPHQSIDDYAEDVGYLLQELDRARAQRDQLARHIEHAAEGLDVLGLEDPERRMTSIAKELFEALPPMASVGPDGRRWDWDTEPTK